MKRELTCIVCPVGCSLTVDFSDGKVTEVTGNTCPRGKVYAENECISPVRTITTTVRCSSGEILPVKTETPIPKEKIFDAMKIINNVHPRLPISVGDVIIENVFGSRVVAVRRMCRDENNCCSQK